MITFAAPAQACQLVCLITSKLYKGNLGGIAGANQKCADEYPGFKFPVSASILQNLPDYKCGVAGGSTEYYVTIGTYQGYFWAGKAIGSTGATQQCVDSGGVPWMEGTLNTVYGGAGSNYGGASCSSSLPVNCDKPMPLLCCNM